MCLTQDGIDSFLSLAEMITLAWKKQAHALSMEKSTSVSCKLQNHLAGCLEDFARLKVVLSLCLLLCSIDLILPLATEEAFIFLLIYSEMRAIEYHCFLEIVTLNVESGWIESDGQGGKHRRLKGRCWFRTRPDKI